MVVTGEVVVVFGETALTWGVRLLSFLAEVVRLVALACCVSVWVFVCPCSPHAGRLQRAVYRFCSRPLCLALYSAAVGPFASVSGQLQP